MFGLSRDVVAEAGASTTLSEGAYRDRGVWPMVRLFHLSKRDVSHAFSHAPEARLISLFAVPLAAVSVLGGLVVGYFGWSTGLLHLLGLYLVLERLAPHLRALGCAETLCGPENTRRVSLTTTEILVDAQPGAVRSEPGRTRSVRWDALLGYYMCPQGLVLVMPDLQREFLPRVWFSAMEFECLFELTRSKAPPPKRALLKTLRPLVITSVLLAVWLVGETPLLS